MRKYILALIACALTAVSCGINDEYYVTNVNDLVTARDNTTLMSDFGVLYTIKNDITDRKWSTGERYLINFDIENADYEITLKKYTKCIISQPTEMGETPSPGEDPITVNGSTISGGYVNLNMDYYRKKESNYAHRIFMEYKDDPVSGNLELMLIHDGNGENPVQMNNDDLEKINCIYSFPIAGLAPKGHNRLVRLTLYEIVGPNVVKNTHQLYNEYITF